MELKVRTESQSTSFPEEVSQHFGGETLNMCYQCGTCASSCPVARITKSFNPRTIIKKTLLGNRLGVLSEDPIWLCCSCYNCQERCPQKVEIADVIYALRNMAFERGYIPDIYSEFASAISKDGRVVTVSRYVERRRSNLGLPPLKQTGVEALREILSATGFSRIREEEEGEE